MRSKQTVVLDFETDPFLKGRIPQPFTAGIYWEVGGLPHYRNFWNDDPEALCREIVEFIRDKNWRIYAHNGGKFDFFFLLPCADSVTGIGGRIAKMTIGKSILVDSYLILPVALGEYKKDSFEYWKMEAENRDKYREEIEEYLRNDCIYLHELVNEFRLEFGTPLTIATASFKKLKEYDYDVTRHTSESWDAKFRPFYFGGRCQAFEGGHGKGNYTYVDINSAYPYAMLSEHPSTTAYEIDKGYLPDEGVYFATIHARSHGALPVRADDGGVSFPDAEGIYHATSWEIEAGLDTGTLEIKDVIETRIPFETQDFSEFVNHFYAARMRAKNAKDDARKLFYKLILNSAYGKFALDPRRYKEYTIVELGDWPEGENWEPNYAVGNYQIFERPEPGENYYNVSTAASITGYVRAMLWRSICQCKDVIYCDTDSIVARDVSALKFGDALGQWERETKITEYWIGGKKLYAFLCADGKYRTASKGAVLTPDDIKRVVNGEIVGWENYAPTFSLNRAPTFIARDIKSTL